MIARKTSSRIDLDGYRAESRKRAGRYYGRRVRVFYRHDKTFVDGIVTGATTTGMLRVSLDQSFTSSHGALHHTAFIVPYKELDRFEVFDFGFWLD